MPRHARIIPNQGYLHVISRGNNQRRLFFSKRDFKIYCSLLKELKKEESVKILHYCLMPNHIHLLVGVTEASDLSRFMKRLNQRYVNYYRKKHNYTGHLWQDRFKSKIIETDGYFLQCGKYIELNPVKANIVNLPQDYPFSSYLHYAFGVDDEIVDDDPFYLDLASNTTDRQIAYRKMVISEMVYKKLEMRVHNSL